MSEKPEPILDPRHPQARPMLKMAKRTTLGKMKKGPVLFYNNTKLEFCHYMHAYTRLKELFAERGIKNIVDFRETVRGKDTDGLRDLAKRMAACNPVAAVCALGDMGTTPATCIVTIALEQLGIPTVYFTAPPGSQLAEATAFYRAGHLCLCSLDIYQGSTALDVRAEMDRKLDFILDCLTGSSKTVEQCATVKFDLDKTPPGEKVNVPGGDIMDVADAFDKLRITDGLPIVPPTKSRLDRMMSYCPWPMETVLAKEIGPTGNDITVRDVAIAAVMAGCKPTAMPILVTAFRCMSDKRYNFLQSVSTSHPGGNMVLVSGPLAPEVGLHGGTGLLGPGWPANLTIGRAVNLVLINCCRSVAGHSDLCCIASQAELTYCFCEDPALSPWPTISRERFDEKTTCVYVLKAEPPHDIIDFLSMTAGDLLDTIVGSATTLGSNNAYMPGNMIVLVTPDHGRLLARDGFTKDMIRRHIHERAHHEVPMVRDRGLRPVRPPEFANRHPMPVTRSPKDIEVIVGGNRGGHSAVILPWALHSEAIVLPVVLPDGSLPKSIADFRTL